MTDGIESAVNQAKAAAAGKSVGVRGADTIQQCLNAGLLDEICASLREVLEAGVRVEARYQGSDGVFVAEAVITKADCSASG